MVSFNLKPTNKYDKGMAKAYFVFLTRERKRALLDLADQPQHRRKLHQ
jgi:hypothetical protein